MRNLAEIESQAFQIASTFLRYYKNNNKKSFRMSNLSNIKSTNWWSFFLKVATNFGERDEFSIEEFVKTQFEEYEKVLPFDLTKEEAYQIYLARKRDNAHHRKNTIDEISSMIKIIKKWNVINNGVNELNVKSFLEDKINLILLIRRNYTFTLLSVCKSFIDLNEDHRIITKAELQTKRSLILTSKKLTKKMMEILKDEFYTGSI
jgi:hypothetical protein